MEPKLCECGCGKPAPIAKSSWKKRGFRKGQPMRFIPGHNAKMQFNHPVQLRLRRWWWKLTTALRAKIGDRKTHSEKCIAGWTPERRNRHSVTMRRLAATLAFKKAQRAGIRKSAKLHGYSHCMGNQHARGKGCNQKALDARVAEIIRTGDPNAKPEKILK